MRIQNEYKEFFKKNIRSFYKRLYHVIEFGCVWFQNWLCCREHNSMEIYNFTRATVVAGGGVLFF